MKKRIGLLCLLAVAVGSGLIVSTSSTPEAAAPCLECPLQPLPDECPPCTQFVPQTCRKCAHCERIKGCRV